MKILKHLLLLLLTLIITVTAYTYDNNHQILNNNEITKEKNPTTTQYNELFNIENVKQIKVSISRNNWDKINNDIREYKYSDTFYGADFIYEDSFGNSLEVNDVGFRIRGNYSRFPADEVNWYRYVGFKIKFNHEFDAPIGSNLYNYYKSREYFDLNEMNIKPNYTYDSTMTRELYANQLMHDLDVISPNVTLTSFIVEIYDEQRIIDFGVSLIVEPVDKKFLKRNYIHEDETIGNLYKCQYNYGLASLNINDVIEGTIGIKDSSIKYRPSYDLKTNKSSADFYDLKDFMSTLKFGTDEELENLLFNKLDYESYLKGTAVNTLLGNPDDYRGNGNNYYLYFHPSGTIHYIPVDLDNVLGNGWDAGNPSLNYFIDMNIYDWYKAAESWGGNPEFTLHEKLLQYENARVLFEIYLTDSINYEYFSEKAFTKLFAISSSKYDKYSKNSIEPNLRFSGLQDVNNYINKRSENIKQDIFDYYN